MPHATDHHQQMPEHISRRRFVATAAAFGAAFACRSATTTEPLDEPARLHIVPRAPTRTPVLGLQSLGLLPALPALQHDGVLYVPRSYRASEPLPLVILLHGSNGSGSAWFGSFGQRAEDARVVMLAPDSRSFSWDAIQDEPFGPDVAFINLAIAETFARCAIDSTRMALMGFSDGASYALSLGLANGDHFRSIVACSPGQIVDATRQGKPSIRIVHGTSDDVLPIAGTSRVIVPRLRSDGYDVTYTEFDGDHVLTSTVADDVMQWLSGKLHR